MNANFSPDLSLYVTLADASFIVFVLATLAGAILAVGTRQLIHAVLGLILSLAGVAGLYVYLGNPFIAMMQVLIYIGAVSISLVFAVMLARPPQLARENPMRFPAKLATGLIVGLFAAFVVGREVLANHWVAAEKVVSTGTVPEIGKNLLTSNVLAFELISLVLLVAITGSVVVARRGRGDHVCVGEKK